LPLLKFQPLYIPHAVHQLPCLSQTDGEWAEFMTGLLSYGCMWASNSSNTNAHETKTHLTVQVISAQTPPLSLYINYQANMSYSYNDQFKQTSGPSSVTPISVARLLAQPYLLNNRGLLTTTAIQPVEQSCHTQGLLQPTF